LPPSDTRGLGAKFDSGKPRWSLLPWPGLQGVVKILEYGAAKYAPGSWRHVPDAEARYTDALLRHQTAILMGEDLDPESGLPHAYHVACNALFLAELRANKKTVGPKPNGLQVGS